ncbi:hypothetical protein LY76DRAFT_667868 [Colletotrichum caudatum]|nr:hypothetical protein LY76DRAFT_667868 [Colletotrichum caudatum]
MAAVQWMSTIGLLAHQKLEQAKNEKNAKKLKDVNAKTAHLLGDIREALANIPSLKRAQNWQKSIEKLQDEYHMPRFVIGVLGDTGSGKSSLVNAVLDEERVVPTNCMRACTAVITEISWNQSEDPAKKYRAEIEFITQAEWTTEVIALHRDILDHNGRISSDVRNADSDAGIAYAVLKTVYPQYTDEQLREANPGVLASLDKVQEVLGKTQIVEERECDSFYPKIQSFVDSEEKRVDDDSGTTNTTPQQQKMAFWPLIKVVRVFLKSDVVSTGAVLVDLPGGRDFNATRAAVAAKYIKECSRLWVVAPINRAVDDKTARDLMGDHFKQQLKYDGLYNNITFICTKADEISIEEATSSLGIKETIIKAQERAIQMETQMEEKKQELAILEHKKSRILVKQRIVKQEVDSWAAAHKKVSKGGTVFAPVLSPQKRKRSRLETEKEAATAKKVKKEVVSSDTDDDNSNESDLGESDDEDEDDCDQPGPLTREETQKKLIELKAVKKDLRDEKRGLIERESELKSDIQNLKQQRSTIENSMYSVCIQGRNTYTRSYIKKDFVFGLKELDEELLAEQQQDSTQQVQGDISDYKQIEIDLPVFCISSRGYQQLRKRMKKDRRVVGFASLNDTEIPGLRTHTIQLAASIQVIHFRHHLSRICRLLGALDLFVAGDVANIKLSDKEKQNETEKIEKSLSELGETLNDAIARCMEDCHKIMKQGILKSVSSGAAKAAEKALSTAEGWGANYDAGGLRYPTYKAICRRSGVFKGSSGSYDFNEGNVANTRSDLLKPLKNCTAYDWDLTFRTRLPEKLKSLATSMKQLIDGFHTRMKNRRFLVENSEFVSEVLMKLLLAQKETLIHIGNEQQKLVNKSGKEANRLFAPVIQQAMLQAYNRCEEQYGKGCFITMKGIMTAHVEYNKDTMFMNASRDVEKAVICMLRDVERMIRHDTNSVINAMHEDYISLVGEVANEADSRARKILGPVLTEFYKKLNVALTPAPETIGIGIKREASGDEYRPGDDDSD